MPPWKRNLIIAALILLFIYAPVTMFGALGQLWHGIIGFFDALKHKEHWH